MKIYNQFTARKNQQGEINNLPSVTIPDQTLSMRELIHRYVQGKPIPRATNLYDSKGYVPEVHRMDLTDIQQLKQTLQHTIEENKVKKREYFTNKYSKKTQQGGD